MYEDVLKRTHTSHTTQQGPDNLQLKQTAEHEACQCRVSQATSAMAVPLSCTGRSGASSNPFPWGSKYIKIPTLGPKVYRYMTCFGLCGAPGFGGLPAHAGGRSSFKACRMWSRKSCEGVGAAVERYSQTRFPEPLFPFRLQSPAVSPT